MQQNQILSGGLWGRFAQSFCVLQGDLDALERVLYQRADPALRAELLPLLRDMACRLPSLERLANQTADIAIGSALRTVHRQDALDLAFLLEELAQDANTELAHRGMTAAVELELKTDSVPFVGDSSLVCAIMVNLLSNALGAKADARVRWTLTGTALICRDDGPGLPEDAWRTLLENSRGAGWMDHGGTGLLLIRKYADCLGWAITCQEGAICFALPGFPANRQMELASGGGGELTREQARHLLSRELDALELKTRG